MIIEESQGGAGETDGTNELTQMEDDGSETDRMDRLMAGSAKQDSGHELS